MEPMPALTHNQFTVLAALLVGLAWLFLLRNRNRPAPLTRQQLQDLRHRGAVILDVRTSREFAQGHAKGARNLPLGQLKDRLGELDPGQPVLNGCAAAMQLLSASPAPLIDELYQWYENTALPDFAPKGMKFQTVKSQAGSPLCHPSIAKWCEASGKKAYSPERTERCGVLTASVARKCAMLLNAQATGAFAALTTQDARTKICMGCHEKGGPMENMRSKQACAPCHSDATLVAKGHQKI